MGQPFSPQALPGCIETQHALGASRVALPMVARHSAPSQAPRPNCLRALGGPPLLLCGEALRGVVRQVGVVVLAGKTAGRVCVLVRECVNASLQEGPVS